MLGLFDRLALSALPLVPRPLMRVLASRYIAGERLDQALARLRQLQEDGYRGILDILGEDVIEEAEAHAVADAYMHAATALADAGIDAYVSVKPTHVGLRLSEELAHDQFARLARHCAPLGTFVRVEMEDHTTTDGTLRIFERLRAGYENVGVVLQARLLRTPNDIDAFLASGPLSVRMVKGVYLEPPSIAHVDPEPIRQAFFDCTKKLFARGAFVSLATHDDVLADRLLAFLRESGIGRDRYELQVLLGVRSKLWQEWREAGEPVRVYVPYGPEWRAYSTRRLKKNPELFRHVLRDLIGRS